MTVYYIRLHVLETGLEECVRIGSLNLSTMSHTLCQYAYVTRNHIVLFGV